MVKGQQHQFNITEFGMSVTPYQNIAWQPLLLLLEKCLVVPVGIRLKEKGGLGIHQLHNFLESSEGVFRITMTQLQVEVLDGLLNCGDKMENLLRILSLHLKTLAEVSYACSSHTANLLQSKQQLQKSLYHHTTSLNSLSQREITTTGFRAVSP